MTGASSSAATLAAIALIWWFGRELARLRASDIRLVWYLFSLAFIGTALIIRWAEAFGAVDSNGIYVGVAGHRLGEFLKLLLDIDAEFIFFGGALCLVVVPQAMSWLLSAPFGCAAAPTYVSCSFRIVFWLAVKSIVSAGGVVFVAVVYGAARGWTSMDLGKLMHGTAVAVSSIAASFILLCTYRDPEVLVKIASVIPGTNRLRHALRPIAAWASRNAPEKPGPDACEWIMQQWLAVSQVKAERDQDSPDLTATSQRLQGK